MIPFEITTERLQLRPLNTGYLSSVNAYAMDEENTRYMCHLPNQSPEESLAFLKASEEEWAKEQPEFFEFAVLYQNQHVGTVSVYFENGIGELGWIILKQYWRRGFAYEATKGMVDYFKEHFGATHFIAHCDTENIASWKTMEKLGMVRVSESGGRRNRAANQDSREYLYELIL